MSKENGNFLCELIDSAPMNKHGQTIVHCMIRSETQKEIYLDLFVNSGNMSLVCLNELLIDSVNELSDDERKSAQGLASTRFEASSNSSQIIFHKPRHYSSLQTCIYSFLRFTLNKCNCAYIKLKVDVWKP